MPIYIGKLKGVLEPFEHILDESDQEILDIIKRQTSGSIYTPISTTEKLEQDNKNKLHQSWTSRKQNYKKPLVNNLQTLPVSQPVLVCHLPNECQALVSKFQNVYILNNIENYLLDTDYKTFIDINCQDFIKKTPSNRTYIYMNQFTGKWKQAQKMWTDGDLRSYNHIDPEVYKDYKGLSLTGAAFLYLNKLYPDEKIVIIGNEIEENCAISQTLWKQYHDQLIFV